MTEEIKVVAELIADIHLYVGRFARGINTPGEPTLLAYLDKSLAEASSKLSSLTVQSPTFPKASEASPPVESVAANVDATPAGVL